MLSAADLAIIERDPALPGLPLLLDADALASRIEPALIAPAYLRYKRGTSCVASYLDRERHAPFAVMAYPPSRFEVIRRRSEWLEAPTPAELLEEACIALVPMALDRGLKGASRLGSPEIAAKLLNRIAGRRFEEGVALTVLRYKPGRRLVARADCQGRPVSLVKAYAADEFPNALIGSISAAALGGAPVLGVDPVRHVIATAWIDGRTLCPAECTAVDHDAFRRTGARLAELHSERFRPPRREGRSFERRRVEEHLVALEVLTPPLARDADPLARAVIRGLSRASEDSCMIHGDFSADQVVLAPAGPVIIDWDGAASGDPARDVAAFFARLDAQVLDGILTASEAEAAQASFADGYRGRAGAPPERLRVQHAAALLALLTEGFRLRRPDWPRRAEGLLRRADALLSGSRARGRSADGTGIPQLDAALDGSIMRERLSRILKASPRTLDLEKPELMRLKPGSRALVRYCVLHGGHRLELVGKIRAKAPDRRTPILHDALRSNGLDGLAKHRVGVPCSRGVIPELHLWLQDAVPGRTATAFLLPGGDTTPSARAGTALAVLHRTPVPTDRTWTLVVGQFEIRPSEPSV